MDASQDNTTEVRNDTHKKGGYIATIIGADIGFVVGAIAGVVLGAVQISSIVLFDFSALWTLFTAIISVLLGGYVGGLVGALIALALTGQNRVARTVGYLALLYPLPLLLAGTDLFIGALVVPLVARWLALR